VKLPRQAEATLKFVFLKKCSAMAGRIYGKLIGESAIFFLKNTVIKVSWELHLSIPSKVFASTYMKRKINGLLKLFFSRVKIHILYLFCRCIYVIMHHTGLEPLLQGVFVHFLLSECFNNLNIGSKFFFINIQGCHLSENKYTDKIKTNGQSWQKPS
jgi:hypothetical protein